MRTMGKVYGLIFDVDGVIADTEAVNARATIKVFYDLFGLEGVVRKDFEAGLGRGAEEYVKAGAGIHGLELTCLLYTSPSPRDATLSRMPSSA